MSDDIVERLRSEAKDVTDFDGRTMKAWDGIRATVEKHKGSDLPRLMFEGLVESLAELMVEGADEIERLRAVLEIIAGSADRLQALQAKAALDNIGAKV